MKVPALTLALLSLFLPATNAEALQKCEWGRVYVISKDFAGTAPDNRPDIKDYRCNENQIVAKGSKKTYKDVSHSFVQMFRDVQNPESICDKVDHGIHGSIKQQLQNASKELELKGNNRPMPFACPVIGCAVLNATPDAQTFKGMVACKACFTIGSGILPENRTPPDSICKNELQQFQNQQRADAAKRAPPKLEEPRTPAQTPTPNPSASAPPSTGIANPPPTLPPAPAAPSVPTTPGVDTEYLKRMEELDKEMLPVFEPAPKTNKAPVFAPDQIGGISTPPNPNASQSYQSIGQQGLDSRDRAFANQPGLRESIGSFMPDGPLREIQRMPDTNPVLCRLQRWVAGSDACP